MGNCRKSEEKEEEGEGFAGSRDLSTFFEIFLRTSDLVKVTQSLASETGGA